MRIENKIKGCKRRDGWLGACYIDSIGVFSTYKVYVFVVDFMFLVLFAEP